MSKFNEKHETAILWIRNDLRTHDNPALTLSMKLAKKIVPVFIWSADPEDQRPLGSASRWYLNQSLLSLEKDYQSKGAQILFLKGPIEKTLFDVAKQWGATLIVHQRQYGSESRKIESAIYERGQGERIAVESVGGYLLCEPGEILNLEGGPYKVFSPFWNKMKEHLTFLKPVASPTRIVIPKIPTVRNSVLGLGIPSKMAWETKLARYWNAGEGRARKQLRNLDQAFLSGYVKNRDFPSLSATSRLSASLRLGEISPRQILHKVEKFSGRERFIRQLAWRDFSYQFLFLNPALHRDPIDEKFLNFPWQQNSKKFDMWSEGRTGIPFVDAGMMQLWESGTMHNRLRMITASYLTKHLNVPWQEGEKWFWDTLVDADPACNPFGWQWVAGCGADAAPYYRVFNPELQRRRFDPKQSFVSKWTPQNQRPKLETEDDTKLVRGRKISSPDTEEVINSLSMGRVESLQRYKKWRQLEKG